MMQILYYLIASIMLAELIIIVVQTVRLTLAQRSLKALEINIDKLADARAQEMAAAIVDRAREDAAKRSSAVTAGKIYEQLAPILPGFKFNPKDVRFLGSPVDFVVFDGLEDGKRVHVRFVELKSGDSKLTDREKAVKDAVESCRVSFEVVRAEDLLRR
ncbi:Holliday junction resolvase-like protein [Acidilobus sp.]|jgi:predicted Holliday junction resolvase-like endonuclease|uniref:Holliday junction resolvase-like protein n=1 Tax=Acidilobus sp. TaxID=1872109 RepID=UPI003CFFD520